MGRQLLDFAETMISERYTEIVIDASLPAKQMYMKRGFVATDTQKIVTDNGDVLVYDVMKKSIKICERE